MILPQRASDLMHICRMASKGAISHSNWALLDLLEEVINEIIIAITTNDLVHLWAVEAVLNYHLERADNAS